MSQITDFINNKSHKYLYNFFKGQKWILIPIWRYKRNTFISLAQCGHVILGYYDQFSTVK